MLFFDLVIHFIFKWIKAPFKRLFIKYNTADLEGTTELDIVIPLVLKDIKTAQLCINSLRKFSLNPIKNIFIVSPEDSQINLFCKENDLLYINEEQLLPIKKIEISEVITDKKKIGWFIQQLIKLNSDLIDGLSERYLVFDSDTILTQSHIFYCKKYTILKFSDEFHFLYRLTNFHILRRLNFIPVSFIAHHMLFHKSILCKLKSDINNMHMQPWYNVILNYAAKNNYFFSEYELYAQYVLANCKENYRLQYWFNKNSYLKDYAPKFKIDEYYQSVSFHNYDRL